MSSFLLFLAGPIGRWLIIASVAASVLAAGYFHIKQIGWDEHEALMEKMASARVVKRQAISTDVVVKYRDRIQVIHEQGKEVIREVEKLVPVDSCDLPGGFRVLHDAAVTGQIPRASLGTDAAAVPAQDATRTVLNNYETCHENAERLMRLQEWARKQYSVK